MPRINVEVEFCGLCMFVVPRDPMDRRVAVVMPDARAGTTNANGTPVNPKGDPHVGTLDYGEAHVIDDAGDGGARKEVTRETLDFGETLPAEEDGGHVIQVPNAACYARELRLLDGVLSNHPPEGVLMWTILRGGRLHSVKGKHYTDFDPQAGVPAKDPPGGGTKGCCGAHRAFHVTWRTAVDADQFVIRRTPWPAGKPITVSVKPNPQGKVEIQVANLCDPSVHGTGHMYDQDFAWFYRLLGPDDARKELLRRTEGVYPIPRVHLQNDKFVTNPPFCSPTVVTADF